MIRNPKRKKTKNNRFEWSNGCTKNDELRKMVSESERNSSSSGQPSEMKRLMVNKALGETVLHRAARQGYKARFHTAQRNM
ncbi:BCL-6 corepressor-like protein [Leptotrombidium deliense]|uniref:BCL-6 corepressor-like protein n=1 Tax=Leptotrombidium deliense TaxID=299467 RepID=A0A443SW57_9ACAR|nr:BCL-6 corepressor-like protein [Leptotrombidium deliense]